MSVVLSKVGAKKKPPEGGCYLVNNVLIQVEK
jgi:hypothetical protein